MSRTVSSGPYTPERTIRCRVGAPPNGLSARILIEPLDFPDGAADRRGRTDDDGGRRSPDGVATPAGRYHLWYHAWMAMTLRLDEQETDALRRRAELEGRSMQEVARQAVRDYIERTSKRELLDRVLDDELPRYAEALERLGQ